MSPVIRISTKTAKALLKFCANKNRPELYGIGITKHGLAATDGFAAVEFLFQHDLSVGSLIHYKAVETSMKLSAVTKSLLTISELTPTVENVQFPNLDSILPTANGKYSDSPIELNPQYLGLVDLVADACDSYRVKLSSVKHGQPLRFDVTGPQQSAIILVNHL